VTVAGGAVFESRRRELRHLWAAGRRALDALVFPWECALCGAPGEASPFCEACRDELLDALGVPCERCAMPVGPWADRVGGCSECRGKSLGFDGVIALGPYAGPIRNLCLRLKVERNAWLAPWLAAVLAESRAEALRSCVPGDSWVVPIPLHWRRRLRRGYNQSEALALGLSKRLALPVARPLRRVRATPPLARSGRSERARLMHDAFRAKDSPSLQGRVILLVDDILTTGATCGAAARALKRAGAARVIAVVIGRAEGKG
jgi:ComF family protein